MGRKESQLKRLQKECDALSHALKMKNEGKDEEIAPRFQKWSKSKLRKKLKHAEKWVGIKESLKFESEEEERTGKNVETVAEDVQLTQEKSTSNQQCTEVLVQKSPPKDIEKRATDSQTSELTNVTTGNENVIAAGEVTKETGVVTTKINDGDGTDTGGDEYIAATDNDNF